MPGAAIPGVLAPTIFYVGLTSVFGNLTNLQGFNTDTYQSFIIPVSLLQGAGFTGAATGRQPRPRHRAGLVRPPARLPRSAPGAPRRPGRVGACPVAGPRRGAAHGRVRDRRRLAGVAGLAIALFGVMAMGTIAALWGCALALRFRSQSAAPLMQAGMFVLILFTTSYAPRALLQPWLQTVSDINPVTQVVEMVRQGFVTGTVTWAETWPGLLALAGLAVLFAVFALRGMNKMAD